MLTFTRVYSLTEVDFDKLFYDSLPEMNNGTYVWGSNVNTDSLKYQHMRTVINQLLIVGNLFMYKVVEDGADLSFVLGILQDGVFNIKLSFTGYHSNMSKSWVYYDNTIALREAFFAENGINSITFNYVQAGSIGTKAISMLGNSWSTNPNIPTGIEAPDFTVLSFSTTKA